MPTQDEMQHAQSDDPFVQAADAESVADSRQSMSLLKFDHTNRDWAYLGQIADWDPDIESLSEGDLYEGYLSLRGMYKDVYGNSSEEVQASVPSPDRFTAEKATKRMGVEQQRQQLAKLLAAHRQLHELNEVSESANFNQYGEIQASEDPIKDIPGQPNVRAAIEQLVMAAIGDLGGISIPQLVVVDNVFVIADEEKRTKPIRVDIPGFRCKISPKGDVYTFKIGNGLRTFSIKIREETLEAPDTDSEPDA